MGNKLVIQVKKGVRGFTPCVFHKPRGRRLMILVKCSHFKTKYIIVYDQKYNIQKTYLNEPLRKCRYGTIKCTL